MKSYYLDIQLLGEYWNCFPDRKRIYHHTICSTLLYGLREAIAMFIEEGGLENAWEKHAKAAKRLYGALESRGFEMFIDDLKNRVPSVTSVKVPKGIDSAKVLGHIMQKYNIEIGGGLGPTNGKIFRIGLMGHNATEGYVDRTVNVLIEAIDSQRTQKASAKM